MYNFDGHLFQAEVVDEGVVPEVQGCRPLPNHGHEDIDAAITRPRQAYKYAGYSTLIP